MKDNGNRLSEDENFFDPEETVSATECTGLIPSAVLTEEESASYGELMPTHRIKPSKL